MVLGWLILAGIVILLSIPLNIAAKLLGGDSSIFKVIFAHLIYAMLMVFLLLTFGAIPTAISFILLLFVYKVMFDVGWIRAFLIWLLEAIIFLAVLFFFF